MAFPAAHPAAVLPLRRFAPRHLDFAALVIGALSPDFAYTLDQVNDLWRTVQWIGGTAAQDWSCVREHWDWDDVSHVFAGSFVFCLPAGLVALAVVRVLQGAFASLLPDPHRTALGAVGNSPAVPLRVAALSVLLGAWTHLAWDNFTNGDRWLAQHWDWLRQPLFGPDHRGPSVHAALWIASSLAGLAWLVSAYARYVWARGLSFRSWEPRDRRRRILWAGLLFLPAAIALVTVRSKYPSAGNPAGWTEYLHQYAGQYLALFTLSLSAVAAGTRVAGWNWDSPPRR